MTTRLNNTRRARLAQTFRLAAALVALAFLAGAGAALALGQDTTATAQYGFYVGTATVNGTPGQAQLGFVTNSTSASYVPTVSLQYGISFSAGPVSCTQTIVPVNNPLVPTPYVQTCTVTITFTPQYPGGHHDALFISGVTMFASGVFLYGIGEAPQLMIQPGVTTSLSLTGSPYLYGSTTDDAGTYYVYANNGIYTVKAGVATELLDSVPKTSNLSIDGAGQLWEPGYPAIDFLCYGLPAIENRNPEVAAASVCFQNPVAVAVGNLGTFYDADGGGESMVYNGQTLSFIQGLLAQQFYPDTIPKTPSIVPNTAFGVYPVGYPIGTNFSPNGMVVDPYENLFFTDPNLGIAVWYGFPASSMHLLNQYIGTNPSMAVDAADTLYASQGTVQMFPASNNYASSIAGIGYGGSVALTPDGTVYVGDGSTVEIIDRFQGSINWGSNDGQVSSQQTLTLYNGGNQPLTISSITSSGAAYTIEPATSNGCTNGIVLASGTICQFLVTSTPSHAGTLTGTVTITSNSLNQPGTVQTVALTGYTSGIWVAATPNPYVFPNQTAGTTSVPLPVTVTNTSAGSNSVGYGSTVAITSGFTSTNSAFTASLGDPTAPTYCGNPLPTGATCLIQVTFNPSQATSYSGTISWTEQITGGGPSMKVSVNVSGNGVPVPLLVPISETINIADSDVVTPSLLIPISETVHIADSDVPTPSLLIPISETVHFTDALATGPGTPTPPFGHLDSAVDSIKESTTIGQLNSVVIRGWTADLIDGAPLSNVKVYIDGKLAGTPTLDIARPDVAAAKGAAYLDSGYQLSYSAAALTLGSHSATAIAIDSGGHSTTFGPLAFTVAATAGAAPPVPPFGHIDSAVDSVTASTTVGQSDSVAIRGWAADLTDGVPLSNVKVYIDGNLIGTPTLGLARPDVAAAKGAAYLDSGYSLSYSAAALSLGPHAVTVIAIDSDARSATFGPLAFTVATTAGAAPPTPPFGHLDSALDNETKSSTVSQSDAVVIRGWAADVVDGAPLSNVKMYVDGTLIGTPTMGIARADVATVEGAVYLNSGYSLTYSVAALSLGSHAITVVAIDSGGRSTTFGPLSFTVAGTPPFGHLDSALDSVTGSSTVAHSDSVVMRGWAADLIDGAPLSNVRVYIDGNLAGTPTMGIVRPDVAAAKGAAYLDSGYQLSYSAATLALGSHSVTVVAIDSGSRSTTFGPLSITVQ